MAIIDVFSTFIYYLTHPFKTHEAFKTRDETVTRLSVYESLGTSWFFIVVHGILRIILLNFILVGILEFINSSEYSLNEMIDLTQIPAYSFIVLSAVLDVVFYPLFGLFLIQFWEIVFKFFGKILVVKENLVDVSQDIVSVALSSKVFKIIPIFGGSLSGLASLFLMYAGLRVRLGSSPVLSVLILMTPILVLLFFITVFVVIGATLI